MSSAPAAQVVRCDVGATGDLRGNPGLTSQGKHVAAALASNLAGIGKLVLPA